MTEGDPMLLYLLTVALTFCGVMIRALTKARTMNG